MARKLLTDAQWRVIAPLLTGKKDDPGRSGDDNRKTLEGVLWTLREGSRWRALPSEFGKWNTVHRRFRRWVKAGVFKRIFDAIPDPDLRTLLVDGTYAKLHQNGAGARRGGLTPKQSAVKQKIGRSHGGLTTKVVAVVDGDGRPVRFVLAPGNRHEGPLLKEAIDGLETSELIADKAYDSNNIRKMLRERGIDAVIPSNRQRMKPIPLDAKRYGARHRVENLFADLKQYRSIATRYCKLADSYEAFLHLAAWLVDARRFRRC